MGLKGHDLATSTLHRAIPGLVEAGRPVQLSNRPRTRPDAQIWALDEMWHGDRDLRVSW